MIAVCLGGSLSVWDDLKEAERLLGDRPRIMVAANFAGIDYTGHLDGWATLHPERMGAWLKARAKMGRNTDCRRFVWRAGAGLEAEVVKERWRGSSGLYMAQVALDQLGATGVILCGVPMDKDAGHIREPGPWLRTEVYRKGFLEARKVIGGQVRSMSGWTARRFGEPEEQWLSGRYSVN
ncbi:MAG: hypothetical protein ACK4FB_08145 [Brevundimonas sp.]|uniref:hypothetical protein n=1 Tax=Brevundimonas sp. TaxID=1871086 RepID=UPI00391D6955